MKDKKTADRDIQEYVMVLKTMIQDIEAGRNHGLHLIYFDDRPEKESRSVCISTVSGLSAERCAAFFDVVDETTEEFKEHARHEALRLLKESKARTDKMPPGRSSNFYDPEVN